MAKTATLVQALGFTDKGARVYLAALSLGETSIQELARKAGVKRTTVYHVMAELRERGAIRETKRKRKTYFIAEPPSNLLKHAQERLELFGATLGDLERHPVFKRPRVYFLYGPSGFKQIWDMLFTATGGSYSIITDGVSFTQFVSEQYVVSKLISSKKQRGLFSRQLIQDSAQARKIAAKDKLENRESKLLPAFPKLAFTEIICKDFVAFISSRFENTLLVVENANFAATRQVLFDLLWQATKA